MTPETIRRSQIKNAPYNPRRISDAALKKLKANIERVGLVDAPVWNRRTGNIVGGHQRTKALDALMRNLHGESVDYLVPVQAVDLTDKEEREQNIHLNNGESQGEWDLEKLDDMFADTEVKIDIDATSFDIGDIYQMFGVDPIADRPDDLDKLGEAATKMAEMYKDMKDEKIEQDHPDFYLVIFKSLASRRKLCEMIDIPDNRYIDGEKLYEAIVAAKDSSANDNPTQVLSWQELKKN